MIRIIVVNYDGLVNQVFVTGGTEAHVEVLNVDRQDPENGTRKRMLYGLNDTAVLDDLPINFIGTEDDEIGT